MPVIKNSLGVNYNPDGKMIRIEDQDEGIQIDNYKGYRIIITIKKNC